ncbi:tryptophan halogenase family protein [Algibacillus agarilyticus]|uniref:tryptophan halogenase family protein n=1 Tax=Algibacillus agarilyticus TaxID=2234133 RepID=UPI000DD04451|nr:tryptophan halogenase family protein [Algibacillus agarilyticus]
MSKLIKDIVIIGGGTAGWLTAGILSSKLKSRVQSGELSITLCESPNIPIVGVGEGTWPTMPETLRSLGISETDFIRECDVSFKQGSKFVGWGNEQSSGSYVHPFDLPEFGLDGFLAHQWNSNLYPHSFAQTFTTQENLGDAGLAPKTISTAEYAKYANYGYHLNATKFSTFLQKHCVKHLNIKHILAEVEDVKLATSGQITSVYLAGKGDLTGDLFIDCTGFKSLLLGESLGVKFKKVDDILFADTALATHVDYTNNQSPIASFTLSTAQRAGWIWDIGLPCRRGVGYVYSSQYTDHQTATQDLHQYIKSSSSNVKNIETREIKFTAGHRELFWKENCVAVGLSAGFLEPLEASAIVLVELSAAMIAEQLPNTHDELPIRAKRFNQKFNYHWSRAIEFLKLHYLVSERSTSFWQDNRAEASVPERLKELMQLWQYDVPKYSDFEQGGELFQAASYQFVLYGSAFRSRPTYQLDPRLDQLIDKQIKDNQAKTAQLLNGLPTNRELINKIMEFGLAKI